MAENVDFPLSNFVKMIENNGVLYDHGHPDYNNEDLKEAVWNAIAVHFNTNVNQCKRVWSGICAPYFAALRVVDETQYASREMILKRCHLKFLDKHLKDFVHQPHNEELINQIILEMRREMRNDRRAKNYGLSPNMVKSIRQVKLNKWCETTAAMQTNPDVVKQIRKTVNTVVVKIIKSMKPECERVKALNHIRKNKPSN